MNIDATIVRYIEQGLPYDDILRFLSLEHHVKISIRTLQRKFRKLELRSRGFTVDSDILIRNIMQMLQNGSENRGYRNFHQRFIQRGIQVQRSVDAKALAILDPEGCARRSRHRLKRRKYITRGPNDTWHADGNDNLKSFGFYIHGAIDGYSRKILWLRIANSNKDPEMVACYLLEYIRTCMHVPRRVRGMTIYNQSGCMHFKRTYLRPFICLYYWVFKLTRI